MVPVERSITLSTKSMLALVVEVVLVDQLERDRHASAAAGDVVAALGEPLVAQDTTPHRR